jgi:galactose mutarotase-like enzyme
MEKTEQGSRNLILENDHLRVTMAPLLGGKIASIQIKPEREELLQKPLQPYALRTRYMSFDASDASGWDECLPSVSACEVETASGKVQIPDHGDFWQVEWEVVSKNENGVTLSADGFSLPLRFRKTLTLNENSLSVAYSIKNTSAAPIEYIWSAHPLFAVDPGDRILLPPSVKQVVVEGSAGDRLGTKGTKHLWSQAILSSGTACDLSIAGGPEDSIGDKLFTSAPLEGWCAIERRKLRRRVELQFDPRVSTHLGLWICYGGWPEGHANRQYCVALEPCNAAGDSLAVAAKENRALRLAPEGMDMWKLVLKVDSVQ